MGTTGNGVPPSGVATFLGAEATLAKKATNLWGGCFPFRAGRNSRTGGGEVVTEFFDRCASPIFPFPAELTNRGGGGRKGGTR